MLASLAAMAVVAQTAPEMRLMRFPTVHEDRIVFHYAGDLWTTSVQGGIARRLTTHAGLEAFPYFSPDGKWIAFTGTYDGNADVFVMSSEGGDPIRLTFEPGADQARGWTPDGRIAFISNGSVPGSFTAGLRLISPEGGLPTVTNLHEVSDLAFSPDGKTVAFNSANSHQFNWRRYRGGTQGRIAFSDPAASTYREIPSGRENRWQPVWIGDEVYYIGDKNFNTRNLYKFNVRNNRETQLTQFRDADIRYPNTDGKTIVWERGGFLEAYDVASGKVRRLTTRIAGDLNSARPRFFEYGPWMQTFSLSPSGNRIAVEARGEIFSVPARQGETRHIGGDSGTAERQPAWSPDGKLIAFMSDKSGEDRLYTMPQMGGDWTELATPADKGITSFRWSPDSKKISFTTIDLDLTIYDLESKQSTVVRTSSLNELVRHDWSPDSNWIVFADSVPNLFGAIYLYHVKDAKLHQVTDGYFNDADVVFDNTGRYLYAISSRVFNPTPNDFEFEISMTNSQRVYAFPLRADQTNPLLREGDEEPETRSGPPAGQRPPAGGPPGPSGPPEVKIDLEGLAARAIALPWAPSSYQFLIGINNGVLAYNNGVLRMFDFQSRASQDIIAGANQFDINPSKTKLAFAQGPNLSIADLRPGLDPNQGRVNLGNLEGTLDPRKEWKQILRQAWRGYRDKFYDKGMLGLDWKTIGQQYEAMLPYVAHRNDLNYVLGLMVGELGTGHSYVSGGDLGVVVPSVQTGQLGADYEVSGNHIRFKRIYRGLNFEEARRGPLAEPGVNVKEGDFLIEIDGQPVGKRNPHEFLLGKVGRTVKLTVNSRASKEGSRTFVVRPIPSEQQLRYIEWVEGNRRKVAELSGGKIGYLHVPDTSVSGMIEFAKGFYSQSDKQAMVIDERFNGGGMIPTFFIENLQRRFMTAFRQRNGIDIGFPTQPLDGPKAMLINQYAGSGGDLLPWLFRENKLGPLIGTRTWGGLVGIRGSLPIVDGGSVTVPEFGLYDIDSGKWIAENTGVDPDIDVMNRPDDLAKGRDPQLERAVQHLMDELRKNPRRPWKRPEFPRIKGQSGE